MLPTRELLPLYALLQMDCHVLFSLSYGYFQQYSLKAPCATLVVAVAGCARSAKRLVAVGFERGSQFVHILFAAYCKREVYKARMELTLVVAFHFGTCHKFKT